MWVGNVPGDASLNELYTFFGQGPPMPEEERKAMESAEFHEEMLPQIEGVGGLSGVISVFLISRSNCAFVNYVSEACLHRGVEYFNGRPLRSSQVDPRCPKLVCRVRKKGDDIKAGVGGQRGVGTHTRWVKEKKAAAAKPPMEDGIADPGHSAHDRPPFVRGGAGGNVKKSSSGSSGSYASTNSGMLSKYFPIRYFILKSLTQHDLDLSVERGLWATQTHNQEVLDQAYRTSQTVYLIFGVNKSGEFFGYAKSPSTPSGSSPAPGGSQQGRWGTPFKVKWIRTNPLSFQRTRHLRNPWNHDREIKVSRDGTEVEPGVGQRLLEEWDRPEPAAPTSRTGAPKSPTTFSGPPSPVQSRGRGRGRGAMGSGWPQRDTGQ
ncbi:hypothetical protein M408DRAFT_307280 [Serendipita vermifera MAFF 305830]|uniref:YTH domain-containing protein n=1 Tax=Serendipita vermifera MAFF 305830 TaxID=933852 RepID=A0A0C3AW25_SERVB|nr:hypothetical protein M408DRAFT_307280 [Serendipita vermifera MAFF 305830]